MQSVTAPRRWVFAYCSVASLAAAFFLNWRHPLLRLTNPVMTVWVGLAMWVVPWIAFAIGFRVVRDNRVVLYFIACAPFLLLTIPPFFVQANEVVFVSKQGVDVTFRPIKRVDVPDGSRLQTYVSDCGMPFCDSVIVLRHERRIVGPVLILRDIYWQGDNFEFMLVDASHVRAAGKTFELKPHVVF